MRPLTIRKNEAERGDAKRSLQRVFEQEAEQPGGNRADDQEPAEAGVVVVADLPGAQRAPEPAHDAHPVAPEERQQHERRCEVRRDQERDEEVVVLVDVPAEQAREDHAVAEAGDGEELADALQQSEERRLSVRDQPDWSCDHALRPSGSLGPLWNQASTSAPIPSKSAAMPCLTW